MFSPPTPAAPAIPAAPASPPVFGQSTTGQKPKPQSSQPTFLGAGLTATQAQAPGKTLLGQ